MRNRRRGLRLGALVLAGGAVLYCLALGYFGYQTHRHLREAQVAVGLLRADLLRKDAPARRVDARLHDVQREARAARSLTSGPVWGVAAALPWAGRPFETVQGASAAVADLADGVLPDLRRVRSTLLRGDLQRQDGGIDLAAIESAQAPLTHAGATATAVEGRVRALPVTGLGPVDDARSTLLDQVVTLSGELRSTREVVGLLPPMMGSDGPRRYLLAFENNTEARGLGGLPGAYAIVKADHGKVSFEHFGADNDFNGITIGTQGLDPDFLANNEGAALERIFVNSTVSPHFPYAATLMMRYWRARTGQHLDGAIATDPSALSLLLAVAGPTRLPDGTVLSAGNVVPLTERDAYARFDDPMERKQFLVLVARAVADDVLRRGPAKAVPMAEALGRAVDQRRLLVYSTRPAEQRVLASRPIGGVLSDTAGPFSAVVVNNGGGNKLDYYLARDVTYRTESCQGDPRSATVTIRLTNRAPASGLTTYVAGRADLPPGSVAPGTNRLLVGYYATRGASFSGATLDGRQVLLSVDRERGRPVFTSELEIKAGQTRTLVIQLDEPASATGPVTTLVQPLVLPQATHVLGPVCAARPSPARGR